jgi:hypothetical protein
MESCWHKIEVSAWLAVLVSCVSQLYIRHICLIKRRKDILLPNKNPEKMQYLRTEVGISQNGVRKTGNQ